MSGLAFQTVQKSLRVLQTAFEHWEELPGPGKKNIGGIGLCQLYKVFVRNDRGSMGGVILTPDTGLLQPGRIRDLIRTAGLPETGQIRFECLVLEKDPFDQQDCQQQQKEKGTAQIMGVNVE